MIDPKHTKNGEISRRSVFLAAAATAGVAAVAQRAQAQPPARIGKAGALSLALLLADCAAPGNQASPGMTHYYCAAAAATGSGPTLVVTERTYPFSGPVSAFAASAPQLQASFAAYIEKTWAGLSISPVCHAEASESAAETTRGAEVGRYEGHGYAIMRASYWQPG